MSTRTSIAYIHGLCKEVQTRDTEPKTIEFSTTIHLFGEGHDGLTYLELEHEPTNIAVRFCIPESLVPGLREVLQAYERAHTENTIGLEPLT